MLYVKTKVQKSEIEGLGLFAAENISKGRMIWAFTPGFDLMLHKDFIEFNLSDQARENIYHYGHREGNLWYLDSDDARFFNSAKEPNTEARGYNYAEGRSYDGAKEIIPNHLVSMLAARDIKAGEEITCNYGEFYGLYDDKTKGSDPTPRVEEK